MTGDGAQRSAPPTSGHPMHEYTCDWSNELHEWHAKRLASSARSQQHYLAPNVTWAACALSGFDSGVLLCAVMLLARGGAVRIQVSVVVPRSVRAFATPQEIEQSIESSKTRKAVRELDYLACPACAQARLSTKAWLNHAKKCCPELLLNEQVHGR